jgi:hypothetical protein
LAPRELYGCAPAKAYEIESQIAQYPRVVVGPYFLGYVHKQAIDPESGYFAELNRWLAKICIDMLIPDVDGQHTIHYLGETYRAYISTTQHREIYDEALRFIYASLDRFRSAKGSRNNTELSLRYMQLLHYFGQYAPETQRCQDGMALP